MPATYAYKPLQLRVPVCWPLSPFARGCTGKLLPMAQSHKTESADVEESPTWLLTRPLLVAVGPNSVEMEVDRVLKVWCAGHF